MSGNKIQCAIQERPGEIAVYWEEGGGIGISGTLLNFTNTTIVYQRGHEVTTWNTFTGDAFSRSVSGPANGPSSDEKYRAEQAEKDRQKLHNLQMENQERIRRSLRTPEEIEIELAQEKLMALGGLFNIVAVLIYTWWHTLIPHYFGHGLPWGDIVLGCVFGSVLVSVFAAIFAPVGIIPVAILIAAYYIIRFAIRLLVIIIRRIFYVYFSIKGFFITKLIARRTKIFELKNYIALPDGTKVRRLV